MVQTNRYFSSPEIQPVLMAEPEPEYAAELALAKRFCECYRADDRFRAAFQDDPKAALGQAQLALAVEDVQPLVGAAAATRLSRRMEALSQEKRNWRESLRKRMELPQPGLNAWRRRQIERCAWQLGAENAEAIVHPPAAFELSRGCSVGCWFCGVSAPKLSDLWRATPENRRLWQDVLKLVLEFCGAAAGHAFLYWATDPLDNPDYETFCTDFHQICGQFPQTTTALALKNPDRTRALLTLAQAHGCPLNRFSVLSLRQMHEIHRHFTPLELLRVELVLQNKESLGARSAAGKALSRLDPASAHATTIACVSGFLFRMPDHQVRWVSPCPASDRWPDGYRVHAEATFADGPALRRILEGWTRQSPRLERTEIPRWRQDLSCIPEGDKIRVQDQKKGLTFGSEWFSGVAQLGTLINAGVHTVEELCLSLDAPAAETMLALQRMHQAALFEDLA